MVGGAVASSTDAGERGLRAAREPHPVLRTTFPKGEGKGASKDARAAQTLYILQNRLCDLAHHGCGELRRKAVPLFGIYE